MKKHSATRIIPPPIDLSASGSNLRRTNTPGSSDKDRNMGGQHPFSKYIIEFEDGTSPGPTHAPPTVLFSPSLAPGPTQALTPGSAGPDTPTSSISTNSFLSLNAKLVPNRRRRSYSESGYSPDLHSSNQRSASSPVCHAPPTSKSTESPDANASDGHIRPLRTSPSFHLGAGVKPKGSENISQHQRPSTGGKRNKLWSSIAHFPLSAGFSGSWDFGHHEDQHDVTTPRKKAPIPGTSPSTPSSWVSFSDNLSAGSALSRVGSLKKRHRPGTASSATSSPSPSPLRSSKLEWHWQWPGKRLSRPKPASSSISLTPVQTTTTSPSTTSPSLHSSPSPLSASSSTSSTSIAFPSPYPPSMTSQKSASQTLRTPSSTRTTFLESGGLATPLSPKSRNRSTPNLKAPDLSALSIEDLGKINAFYAPPPPAIAVQALADSPRRRAASSGTKSKPKLPFPPEMPEPLPKGMYKPLPVPNQANSLNVTARRASKGQGIPIALPLSPAGGVGGRWDGEEEVGVIFLTVEDVVDEESGETVLRLVEVP